MRARRAVAMCMRCAGRTYCKKNITVYAKWEKVVVKKGAVKKVTVTGTSKTLSKLSKGKNYYVKVRAYKKDSTGAKVYGSFSGAKKVKISK